MAIKIRKKLITESDITRLYICNFILLRVCMYMYILYQDVIILMPRRCHLPTSSSIRLRYAKILIEKRCKR